MPWCVLPGQWRRIPYIRTVAGCLLTGFLVGYLAIKHARTNGCFTTPLGESLRLLGDPLVMSYVLLPGSALVFGESWAVDRFDEMIAFRLGRRMYWVGARLLALGAMVGVMLLGAFAGAVPVLFFACPARSHEGTMTSSTVGVLVLFIASLCLYASGVSGILLALLSGHRAGGYFGAIAYTALVVVSLKGWTPDWLSPLMPGPQLAIVPTLVAAERTTLILSSFVYWSSTVALLVTAVSAVVSRRDALIPAR